MANEGKGKLQTTGVLKGHFRTGRVYKPAMRTLPHTISDWYKQDFPDLLWPAVLGKLFGNESALNFRQIQQFVLDRAGKDTSVVFDGRLTSLDDISADIRTQIIGFLAKHPKREKYIPKQLVSILRLYDDVPGSWLLIDPWEADDGDQTEPSLQLLFDTAMLVVVDNHASSLAQLPTYQWQLLNGKAFVTQPEHAKWLANYPNVPDEIDKVDSIIKSHFKMSKMIKNPESPATEYEYTDWTKRFWRKNYELTSCISKDNLEEVDGQHD